MRMRVLLHLEFKGVFCFKVLIAFLTTNYQYCVLVLVLADMFFRCD